MLVAAVALLSACGRPAPERRDPAQNVLLITIDTLRADAVGAYGNATVSTPWMDRLAAGGVRFAQAHASTVVTLPSHANILSGLYPFRHGVRENAGFRFPAAVETLASLLKARGYRTAAFVSAFPLDARFGLTRGFDIYDDRFPKGEANAAFRVPERRGADTVAAALAWIGRREPGASAPAAPWLAWVHLYEPHFPYAPPEPYASRYRECAVSRRGVCDRRGARTAAPADSRRHGRPRHARRADLGPRRVARRAWRDDPRAVCLRRDAAGAARSSTSRASSSRRRSPRRSGTSTSSRRSSTRSARPCRRRSTAARCWPSPPARAAPPSATYFESLSAVPQPRLGAAVTAWRATR